MTLDAPRVISLELIATDGSELPLFEPGAHIDLHLPGGIVRQYSLLSDPTDRFSYCIGIKIIDGGMASYFVQRKLRLGDVLTIGSPRNNFRLVEAGKYIFVAGGIGVAPLIPMVRAVNFAKKPWMLFYCNRRDEDAPFMRKIPQIGGSISLHSSQAGARMDVFKTLSAPQKDTSIYCCGPESLMSAVEEATAMWPQGSVNFEWFAPRNGSSGEVVDSFEVFCERSGLELKVSPSKSVLEVLNDAGIEVPSSCRQGICGTCEVRVISGEVDHRDSILSRDERAENRTMMTCVSRAHTARLVLDI